MKLPNIKHLADSVLTSAKHHSPQILTGLGIAGMITTVVLAVKATPKALELIDEAKKEKGEDLTPVETVKVAWKPYVKAAVTGTLSTACLVGADSIHTKRATMLTAAYKLSETALSEYKDAVVETIGEKKAEEVKEKVAEKHIQQAPLQEEFVYHTGTGNHLCYDHWSGMYFRSSYNAIKSAQNTLNRAILEENCAGVSVIYDALNLPHTHMSEELGWDSVVHREVEIEVKSKIASNGEPCLVLDYDKVPVLEYWRL